jgi:competence protein ComEC
MRVLDEDEPDRDAPEGASAPGGLAAAVLAACGRLLEAEQDRWMLWVPVLFAAGILTYFALADEPATRLALALLVGALGIAIAVRHARLGLCIGGIALAFAAGFGLAKLRTEMVRAPVLAHELKYATVAGLIEAHELRDKGRARITLRVLSIENLPPEETPYRVRVSMPGKYAAGARIGDAVTLRATLEPPPEPNEPGGFDFARSFWFAQLGATGYATSRLEPFAGAPSAPIGLAAWAKVDALRAVINARIRAALSGETGEIAVALITGERGGISEEVNQSMRDSGLTHILSISGLHMAVMAGTVFWLVRALLALFPSLALRYPSRNGRLPRRSWPRPSTSLCRAPPCPRSAPGS